MLLRSSRNVFRFCLTTPNSNRANQNGRGMAKELLIKYRNIILGEDMPSLAKEQYQMVFLERNEIETRIRKVLFDSGDVDLKKFRFDQDLRRDVRLDSLQLTALLTSIEAEFTTVFDDKLFEGVEKLEDIVNTIHNDPQAF